MMQPPERLTEGQIVMFQLTKAPWAPSKTEIQSVLILISSQQTGRGVQSDPKSKAKEICSHLSEAWAVVLLRHLKSRIGVLYVHS